MDFTSPEVLTLFAPFFSAAKQRGKKLLRGVVWLLMHLFLREKKEKAWVKWMVNIVSGNFWIHVFFTIHTKKRSPDLSDEFQGICILARHQPVLGQETWRFLTPLSSAHPTS